MADNIELNSMSGGATMRTLEDVSSLHYQPCVFAFATSVGTPDAVTIPTGAALADNTSNPTTLSLGSYTFVFDGTTWDRWTGAVTVASIPSHDVTNAGTFAVQAAQSGTWNVTTLGTITNVVHVDDNSSTLSVDDGAGSLTVDNNGTFVVQAAQSGAWSVAQSGTWNIATVTTVSTVTTCSTVSLNSDVRQGTASNLNAQIVGTIAHDGVDSGNPVKVGMRAFAFGSNPTEVAAADRTDWLSTRAGVPFVLGGHPNIITRTARVSASDGAQTNASILTISSGNKVVITRVSVTASAANSVNVRVKVGIAAATLAADSASGAAGVLVDHTCPAGGGITVGDGSGVLAVGADDEDVRITCDSPTSGHVAVSISYFTIAT